MGRPLRRRLRPAQGKRRLLPAEYGNWNSVYKRAARWSDRGIWELLHQHSADGPDMEYLIISSTVAQAPGRSRDGFSTKVHVSVDSLGNPLRFILTGGKSTTSPKPGG